MNEQTEAWKALVTQLPGILGAEFTVDNSTVREVHILSDQSRSPKQVVRDVQSALLARFQLELDHRCVSVAQIPGAAQEARRRLICDGLELSSSRDGAGIKVVLRLDEHSYTGEARCDLTAGDRFRAIASATVAAINHCLAPGCRFSLDTVRTCPMGERQAVLVGLLLKHAGKTEALLGACYEGEDPNFSAALATLDGVNRRLMTRPPASACPPQTAS